MDNMVVAQYAMEQQMSAGVTITSDLVRMSTSEIWCDIAFIDTTLADSSMGGFIGTAGMYIWKQINRSMHVLNINHIYIHIFLEENVMVRSGLALSVKRTSYLEERSF